MCPWNHLQMESSVSMTIQALISLLRFSQWYESRSTRPRTRISNTFNIDTKHLWGGSDFQLLPSLFLTNGSLNTMWWSTANRCVHFIIWKAFFASSGRSEPTANFVVWVNTFRYLRLFIEPIASFYKVYLVWAWKITSTQTLLTILHQLTNFIFITLWYLKKEYPWALEYPLYT